MLERDLMRKCVGILAELKAHHAVLDWYHRDDRKPRPGRERSGLPDLIIAVRPGLVLGIELKTPEGRLGPHQAGWLVAFGDRGGLARSTDEFLAILKRNGVVG